MSKEYGNLQLVKRLGFFLFGDFNCDYYFLKGKYYSISNQRNIDECDYWCVEYTKEEVFEYFEVFAAQELEYYNSKIKQIEQFRKNIEDVNEFLEE